MWSEQFSKEKHTDGWQVHEENIQIINIMKMQIKPQWDITLYLLECFYKKRHSTVLVKMWRKGNSLCTVDGKVNHADPVENSMKFQN